MTATLAVATPARSPFEPLTRTPAHHFDLYFYAAIVRLRAALPGIAGSVDTPTSPFAFLRGYFAELPDWMDPSSGGTPARWYEAIEAWEATAEAHLPLRALRTDAGLGHDALTMLAAVGLVDEDTRFAAMFQTLQRSDDGRPTAGLLCGWWDGTDERRRARRSVDRLVELGVVDAIGADASHTDVALRPTPGVWDVLRNDSETKLAWARHGPANDSPQLTDLIVPPDAEKAAVALPRAIRSGVTRSIVMRGPGASGRRTFLAAVARVLGLGRLDVDFGALDPARWRQLGTLATALRAMPIVAIDTRLGETLELPALEGYIGPVGIALPAHGSVRGPDLERSIAIWLGVPDRSARRRHWRSALGSQWTPATDEIADRYRMTAGNIRRTAVTATSVAALAGRSSITPVDVLDASRTLRTRALESLATPVLTTGGGWDGMVVPDDVARELSLLEQRCRSRERLVEVLAEPVALRSAGVRVLFTGPSGTGKTLAARILASVLSMDLYAVEVGRIVDKYLGETEKNLTAVFARAAELDAMLLVDEGDSLLTSRTDVRSSNDRYANLQTNHLLQQLEAHDGIVIITTNAGDRIDGAFQRRLDVVVEFRAPDAALRWELWQRHLPPRHAVDEVALSEIATRCALTGGQIRNAALHAWLLALKSGDDAVPGTAEVDAAVRREYRKLGATCPLRSSRSET